MSALDRSQCRPASRIAGAALALAALLPPAAAGAQVTVSAQSVEVAGLRARDVELRLSPAGAASAAVRASAGSVDGVDGLGRLERVAVDCRPLAVRDGAVRCEGRLSGRFGRAGAQDSAFVLEASAADRARLAIARLALAGGTLRATANLRGEAWTAEATFADLALEEARTLAGGRSPLPADFSLAGTLAGSLEASGRGAALGAASGALALRGLAAASADGTLASDGLGLDLEGRLAATRGGHDFELAVKSAGGQAYVEPWFADLGRHPVAAEAAGRLAADASSVELSRLDVSQAGVGRVTGSGRLRFGDGPLVAAMALATDGIDLEAAVPLYVQPPLVSTAFRDVGGAGRVRGEVEIADDLPRRFALELEGVGLASAAGGLGIEGLEGRVNWHDEALRNELGPRVDSAVFKSLVGWRSAKLWGIEIGGAELPFTTTGGHFRLLDPVFIPVFDGGIALDNLRLRNAGTPQMYLRFDAEVRPISVARIGRALAWPEFGGTLSGRIPTLQLADGAVTLGGNLEARVFDGTVTVRDLKLRDPLGQFPQLSASIDVDRLDLEQMTSTFEFGLITGRLSGRVEGLELFDWAPVRFDARFYSTPGDRTPRRISQRAVANLSSIGGGSGGSVTAALQSGFLQFFKTFRYAELGLSCRLANDVCRMDGVAPADNGYYIVRGAGLPRIDVIASQRRVAWTRLVRQLAAMTQGGELVVE
jgi:hypothetical protein